jgi:hypothetical protein
MSTWLHAIGSLEARERDLGIRCRNYPSQRGIAVEEGKFVVEKVSGKCLGTKE